MSMVVRATRSIRVVNARCVALAAVARGRPLRGVRDVVPTYQRRHGSLRSAPDRSRAIAAELERPCRDASARRSGRRATVEIPVDVRRRRSVRICAAVAEFARCSEDEVVRLHARVVYRVYMLGFLPGFAYMGSRRRADRDAAAGDAADARAAGSVGIAGEQTGIYPCDTPGGWRIIGRTAVEDVRSVARRAISAEGRRSREVRRRVSDGRVVRFVVPGMFTTVQDLGRWGFQSRGVPVSGAMDWYSHRLANRLLGNRDDDGDVRSDVDGTADRFERTRHLRWPARISDLTLNDDASRDESHDRSERRVDPEVWRAPARGARAYLAMAGGVDVPVDSRQPFDACADRHGRIRRARACGREIALRSR